MPLAVLQRKLEEVPEMYFGEVSAFLDGILAKTRRGEDDEAEIPNAATRAALREAEEMRRNRKKYRRFSSFADVLDEARHEVHR